MLHSCCLEVDPLTLCLLRKMVVKKSNWIALKFGFEFYFLFSSAANDISPFKSAYLRIITEVLFSYCSFFLSFLP